MRLITFSADGVQRVGVMIEQSGEEMVVDVCRIDPSIPLSMVDLLAGGYAAFESVQKAVTRRNSSAVMELQRVKLLAPVPRPGKIICVGLNYRDHALEGGRPIPQYPTIFNKYSTCVIGPGEAIRIPKVTNQVDYEAELAVVIGKRCKDVAEEEAIQVVAGYTCFNDVSARDYQNRTSQWTVGKSFDTFGPMGPALVTADEVGDPGNLEVRGVLNGVEMQHSNTRELIFTVPYLIHFLSEVMTLEPGDVISTGTPAGVGVFRQPPVFLKAGDEIRVEIERVGTLVNRVTEGDEIGGNWSKKG